MSLNKILADFRAEKLKEDEAFRLRTKKYMRESKEREDYARNLLRGKLVNARVENYVTWLKGYLGNGNLPTHSYDYPMSRVIDEFFFATNDFEISPLFGAKSISIIVPEKVKFLGGELGHNQIYLMDEYKNIGGFVPVYLDIAFKE